MKLLFIFGASILLAIVTITSSAPRLVNFSKMTCSLSAYQWQKKKSSLPIKTWTTFALSWRGWSGLFISANQSLFFYFLYFDNILFLFYQNEKCGLLNSDSKASPQLNCRALKSTKNWFICNLFAIQ